MINQSDVRLLQHCFKPKPDNIHHPHPAYEFYRTFLRRKLQHSLLVAKLAEKIIIKEARLCLKNKSVQKDFIKAALFHDVGRTKEVCFDHTHPLFKNHGMESAYIVHRQFPLKSLNVLIPIMLHEYLDTTIILNNPSVLKSFFKPEERQGYILQNNEGVYENAMELLEKYCSLSSFEQNVIKDGINLIRDADKCANLLEIERMLGAKQSLAGEYITPAVQETFLKGKLLKTSELKTLPDWGLYYMAWLGDLNYQTSLRLMLNERIPERIIHQTDLLFQQKAGKCPQALSQSMENLIKSYVQTIQRKAFHSASIQKLSQDRTK